MTILDPTLQAILDDWRLAMVPPLPHSRELAAARASGKPSEIDQAEADFSDWVCGVEK